MKHAIKKLRGYVAKSGRPLYECECKKIIEAWNLVEAKKIHKKELEVQDEKQDLVNN